MRYIRLVAVNDQFDVNPGLMIKSGTMPDSHDDDMIAADRDGTLLAHDLLEHQNGVNNIGPIWDELEALGGLWFVRGRWGDLMTDQMSYYSPAHNIASDIANMWEDLFHCDYVEHENMLGRHKLNTKAHDYDCDFLEIIRRANKDITARMKELCDQEGDLERCIETRRQILRASLHHMRIGFNKAKRRFGDNHYRFKANDMFRRVRDAVRDAHKMVRFEGQEFILGYSSTGAMVREVYEEEY